MKEKKGLFRYVPLCALIFCAIGIAGAIVLPLAKQNMALAEALNNTSGTVIRMILATITTWMPFSFAETLLLASPLLLIALVWIIVRLAKKSLSSVIRFSVGLLSCGALIYGIFVFGYDVGYYGKTLDAKLALDKEPVSAQELYDTAMVLIEKASAELDEIVYDDTGAAIMPFTISGMNKHLNTAYRATCKQYTFLDNFYSNAKPLVLSHYMTYTHLSGIYCFFTGEANINTNYPQYIVVSSAAHEMAHQRGITKEDEANFVSFLVCSNSDNAYVRYSGYMDVLQDVLGSLGSASSTLHAQAYAAMPKQLRGEFTAFSKFFEPYRENVAATVTTTVNNAYIQQHNQEAGSKSYGLVADLVVAYYKSTGEIS